MGLFRSRPFAEAEVVLIAANRAAAGMTERPGRTPERRAPEAVALAIGLVAAASHTTPDARAGGTRECLVELAHAIAAAGDGEIGERLVHLGPLGQGDFLVVDALPAEGRGRVGIEVVRNRRGVVPRLTDRPDFAGPSVEIAALALAQAVAATEARDANTRLALALGIEGVLAWYAEADRMTPPGDAMRFALVHMAGRMEEAGRTPPPGLVD